MFQIQGAAHILWKDRDAPIVDAGRASGLLKKEVACRTIPQVQRGIGEAVDAPSSDELGVAASTTADRLEAIAGSQVEPGDRRRLAIEAEIASGLDSPAEDKQLRLELQVERLNRGMSGNRDDEDAQMMAATWCATAGGGDGDAALRKRFFAALKRLAE